jgi:hypothetical protein
MPYFIIKFINIVFDMFNEERYNVNIDLKRFDFILKNNIGTVEFIQDKTEEIDLLAIKEQEEVQLDADEMAFTDQDAEYDDYGDNDSGENNDIERFGE